MRKLISPLSSVDICRWVVYKRIPTEGGEYREQRCALGWIGWITELDASEVFDNVANRLREMVGCSRIHAWNDLRTDLKDVADKLNELFWAFGVLESKTVSDK